MENRSILVRQDVTKIMLFGKFFEEIKHIDYHPELNLFTELEDSFWVNEKGQIIPHSLFYRDQFLYPPSFDFFIGSGVCIIIGEIGYEKNLMPFPGNHICKIQSIALGKTTAVYNRIGSMVELEGHYKIFEPEDNILRKVSNFEPSLVLNPRLLLSIIEIDGEELRSIECGGTSVVIEKFWNGNL